MLLTTLSLLLLSHSLEVKITGPHSDKGHVRVLLFTSAEGWPAYDAARFELRADRSISFSLRY